jgi:beta-phosphoglucomutase-like phosphatase (HAD superfamily)
LRTFLTKSQSLGIPLALATSAEEQNIALVLDGLDLRRYFSVIVGARDIRRSKPDPEIFLVAADRIGVPRKTAPCSKIRWQASRPRSAGYAPGADRPPWTACYRRK